jgi:hypothetical protein
MSRKLIQAFIVSTKTLTIIKKEIDQEFVNNDIKLEKLEVKKNIKGTYSFVAVIKLSQSTIKIKNILNKIGKVSWFIVVTGKSATQKKHKKWSPKTRKVK